MRYTEWLNTGLTIIMTMILTFMLGFITAKLDRIENKLNNQNQTTHPNQTTQPQQETNPNFRPPKQYYL